MDFHGKRALIFIEDGSFLLDNRVQREARTLRASGLDLTIVCPRYPGEKRHDIQDGIRIYRYRKWIPSDGFVGHMCEYASSLVQGGLLSAWAYLRHGFDLFHACNPPDILFLIGRAFKPLGVRFVFDHHDLCPELYLSRFRRPYRVVHRAQLWLEKRTLKAADVVIATNGTYKRFEMERGGVPEDRIFVVRNGPDLAKFHPVPPDPDLTRWGKTLVGYLGNMNPQDGVIYLLRAAHHIRHVKGRDDLGFVLVGSGGAYAELTRSCEAWGLSDTCRFLGRLPHDEMLSALSACHLCVQPDPSNPLNDASTMNKVMEYMALGKAVVAFDLPETRVSGGDAMLYAEPNRVEDLAEKILELADRPEEREELGRRGQRRVRERLSWENSEPALRAAYAKALSRGP